MTASPLRTGSHIPDFYTYLVTQQNVNNEFNYDYAQTH